MNIGKLLKLGLVIFIIDKLTPKKKGFPAQGRDCRVYIDERV
jgi:hypothetical protein